MFGIGGWEFIIIIVFGFIIFGRDKLPEIAKTVGSAISKFRGAQEQMSSAIKTGVYDPNSDEPFKNPLDLLSQDKQKGASENNGKAAQAVSSEKKTEDAAPGQKGESIAERKAKYAAKQETPGTKKATPVAEEEKPSVEDLYATDAPPAKPAAKKTVKRAPAKQSAAKTPSPAKTASTTKTASASPAKTAAKTTAKPDAKTTEVQKEAK